MNTEKLMDGVYDFVAKSMQALADALVPRLDSVERSVADIAKSPGKDGINGKDGPQGERGERGEKGERGADGHSVTAEDFRHLFEAESAKWFLEYERRTNDAIKGHLATIPTPKDGADGFGFDDFDIGYDGERGFTFKFQHGDRLLERTFTIPLIIDRGVFKRGSTYQLGDGVTHGGSYWIARNDSADAPGENNSSWRLAVKRGRDGKDK